MHCHPTLKANFDLTCLQGTVDVDFETLVKIYGEPNIEGTEKTDWEWLLETPSGVATIYNWKNGPNYGVNATPDDIKNWHIGGRAIDVVVWINKDIEEAKQMVK